jgi:hypothetical protein
LAERSNAAIDRCARNACAAAAQRRFKRVANTAIDVSAVERIDDAIGVNAVFTAISIALWKIAIAHRVRFSMRRSLRSDRLDL